MKGYMRCEYMSPSTGLQCEIWFESQERKYSEDGKVLPILCAEHSKGHALENGKEKHIELVNIQRKFCENMTLDELDAHIAKIEVAIEDEKRNLITARAVKQDKLGNLSETERLERLKYKVKKIERADKLKTSSATIKSDPVKYLAGKGLSTDKAKDLLTMNLEDLMAKYQQKKDEGKK